MATRDRGAIRLYSRNGKDLTGNAPTVVARLELLIPEGVTVLGEMVYIQSGIQEIGLVQSILHSGDPGRAKRKSKSLGGRLEFVVYDCIEYDGKSIAEKPWSYRRSRVENTIPAGGIVRTSKVYSWTRRDLAMLESIRTGGEGIVIKVKDSPYLFRKQGSSEPHGQWWKYKAPGEKAHIDDVILAGYKERARRPAFEMYQIDHSGKRVFVGYISNLPRNTEKEVQKISDRGGSVVAEISYQERLPTGKFRHPGWVRLRPDKPFKSATMPKTMRSKKSKANPSRGFQDAIDFHLGRTKNRHPNPRPSKVKDALAAEATRFKDFDKFANAYWNACARGLYWYPTDDKRFYIGEHERTLIESGRFNVACSPELALSGKNEKKKYVAELDVTRVPEDAIRMKRGEHGSVIKIVGAPGSVKVARVLDTDAAHRAFLWQLSILPSSKEGLRKVWEKAWEKRERSAAIQAIRSQKEQEREEKRASAKREKEKAAVERHKKRRAAEVEREEQARKKGIREAERIRKAEELSEKERLKEEKAKKKAVAAKKKASKRKMQGGPASSGGSPTSKKPPKKAGGKSKRVPSPTHQVRNPSPSKKRTRSILFNVNIPEY